MLNNLLLYRLIILNVLGAVGVAWAWSEGLVAPLFAGDPTRLTVAIAVLFVVGLFSVFARAAKVARLMNVVKMYGPGQCSSVTLRVGPWGKFLEKAEHIGDISNWLVTLGLIGTLVGLFIALTHIDASALATPEGIQKTITQFMTGMSVAITTSIVGGVAALWLEVNRRILTTASVCLVEDATIREDDL